MWAIGCSLWFLGLALKWWTALKAASAIRLHSFKDKLCACAYYGLLSKLRPGLWMRGSGVCNTEWKGHMVFLWALLVESENYWAGAVLVVLLRYAAVTAIKAVWCHLVVLALECDFLEICINVIPVFLQWQAVFKVRLNISKLYVVCIFYLCVGEAAVPNNTPWHLLFKDFSGLFLAVLAFYWLAVFRKGTLCMCWT